MKVTFEFDVYDSEPRYLVRIVGTREKPTALAGNPDALGRGLTKIINRAAELVAKQAAEGSES